MKSLLVCLLLVLVRVSPSHQYGETDQRAGAERIGDSGLNFYENITDDTEKSASVIQDKMRATSSLIMPAVTPKIRHMITVTPRSQRRRNRALNHKKPTPKRRKNSTKRVKPAIKRPKPAIKRPKPATKRPKPAIQRPKPAMQRLNPAMQRLNPAKKRLKSAKKRPKPTTTRPKPTPTTPPRRVVYDSSIVCHLPIDRGNCEDLSLLPSPTVRYGYDRTEAGCIHFVYSGCGGNANRFTSYVQCLTTCIPPEVSYNDFLTILQYLNRQSI